MARLPSEQDLGARPIPISRKSVVVDQSGIIIADAIARAGQQLSQYSAEQLRKDDALRYESAKSTMLHAHNTAIKELEDIPDFTTWQKEYKTRMEAALERVKTGKVIQTSHDRNLFDIEAKRDIEIGGEKVRERAHAKSIDVDRAGLRGLLEANHAALLETDDPDIREAFIISSKNAIHAAEQKGSISAQEAENMDSSWTHDVATGMLSVMPPEERAKILANPKGTPAETLHADERAVMLRQAQEENKTTRVRAKMQAESDKLMQLYSTRSDALEAARKISDPDVRAATVDDINQRFNEIQAIKTEAEKERFKRSANMIEGGKRTIDIPAQDWANLSVAERAALETRQRQVSEGIEPVNDGEKFYQWYNLTPIEEQATTNLLELRPYLDDAHFERAIARQRAILDAQAGGKDGSVALTNSRSDAKRIEQALIDSKLFESKPTATHNKSAMSRWTNIESAIMDEFESQSAELGRRLKPEEKQKIIDQEVMDRYFVDENFLFADPQRLAIELTAEQAQKAYIPYEQIPDESKRMLENLAKSYGWPANETNVEKAYAAAKLRQGNDVVMQRLRGD